MPSKIRFLVYPTPPAGQHYPLSAGLSYKKSACQFHPFEPNNRGEIAELDSIHGHIGLNNRVDSHLLKTTIFTFSLLVGLVDFL